MDDRALEILCASFDQAITLCPRNADQAVEIPEENSGECEGSSDFVDTSVASDDTQELCPQAHPNFQKLEALSNKLQIIREEHARLGNEVKGMSMDSLVGSEALTALENLGVEHELLKNKYHEECELLKKKYVEECSERKRLYNEVIELKGNIRVFCRCRPLKQDEIDKGSTSVVDFDSSQENELQIISSESSKKQFKFDHVFRPEDNQEAVFHETMPIVTSVLDGYNVCIFAYGQTGTGKTYTMEGTSENRGVNYRTLKELFRISSERSSIMRYELFVSMLEVYNEKIRDLLVENPNNPAKKSVMLLTYNVPKDAFRFPSLELMQYFNPDAKYAALSVVCYLSEIELPKLDIKQSAEGTQEVPGLVEARVYDTDGVWSLLKSGSQVRSVGSTNANEFSSRSHCLLRVSVAGENLINGQKTRSHLWLVDLAGSERVGRIEVEGERLKESQFINKSLAALGDVISALASKSSHVPYRNSKLTHMLQSSLGGDCKTLMFVQISPNSSDLGETICSLNFASRVRGVEHGPARRQTDHSELLKYKQLAEKAKQDDKEVKKLQESVQSLQLRLAAREQICKNLQEKVRDLETQLAEERKTRLKQENRALASLATQSTTAALTSNQAAEQKLLSTDIKKPPLAPSKLRLPLRRISNNYMPAPSPANKKSMSYLPIVREEKENISRPLQRENNNRGKQILKARRGSIAVRPSSSSSSQATTGQVIQPKRRASIATFRPESNSHMSSPPLQNAARQKPDRAMGRQSFVWDPKRVWRTSRVLSPLPQSREAAPVEATPVGPRNSKFRGSPPSVVGSWKPKHPTVVALQKKHLVWSPLKMREMKNKRNSMLT